MYFNAISIGYAVPRADFDAKVHSVFRSAINLRLTNNILLTLVTSREADLPQGIRVNTPDDFSFEIFQMNEQVACRDDILRCASSALTIDLRDAESFICDLSALQADMTHQTMATAWRFVWQTLNQRQIESNAEIIAQDLFRSDGPIRAGVPRKAGEAMRRLFAATRQFDLTAASHLDKLIGLGAGLTPSGDDLLVGCLAGLWCIVQDKSERMQFVSNLGKAVIRLSHQTNDISSAYLYHATQGQVSSRLADLAEAICRGENSDRLLTATESAMQVGHTSGMDAVTGLLVGLTVWNNSGIYEKFSTVQMSKLNRKAREEKL
jgi:hypothetical protein